MDEIMRWLCKFAYDHNIAVTIDNVHFKSDVPSTCYDKHVLINTNWDKKEELPFIFAHELGHALNDDDGVLYYSTSASQSKIESEANSQAIDIMLEYSQAIDETPADYLTFMHSYNVPSFLDDEVKRRYSERFKN